MRDLGRLLGAGAGSEVYEYGENLVCKLFVEQYGKTLAEWEFEKTQDAYRNGLPAPKVASLVKIGNRFGIVMERLQGVSYMHILMAHLDENLQRGVGYEEIFHSSVVQNMLASIAAQLARLHRTECGLAETAKGALRRSCTNNRLLTEAEKSQVLAQIERLEDGATVCHGDPNPGNFLVHNGKVRIIDWMNCMQGSPLYDLTEFKLLMEYATLSMKMPEPIEAFIESYKFEFVNLFYTEYSKIEYFDLSETEKWHIPILVAKMGGNNSDQKQSALLGDIRRRLATLQ